MDVEYDHRRSGQIPAFGNWDYANQLPITQYFETARQAGLLRYSSSSSADFNSNNNKGTRNKQVVPKEKEAAKPNMRKQGKVCDVTEQPRKPRYDAVPRAKPVDEDLYKIPPELLRTTKRKKMLGFISKCLVPAACVS
ncbi:hypothetical protein Fmac_007141 [Flemingia macrophylla]|uniref:Uncharacterized protein n=1 Tax=Flemingia macrophylla TaxID=520843 RepID=A0ABD1ND31_9FABA